jgi:hypothetical protein
MPHFDNSRSRGRVGVELFEADVETIYSLIDAARTATERGDSSFADSSRRQAQHVLLDVRARLERLGYSGEELFRTLLDDLEHEIASV